MRSQKKHSTNNQSFSSSSSSSLSSLSSSSHSDLRCRFPEVEKNDWDVDDAEDDTVEIGVTLISRISRSVCLGADRSITALTKDLSLVLESTAFPKM